MAIQIKNSHLVLGAVLITFALLGILSAAPSTFTTEVKMEDHHHHATTPAPAKEADLALPGKSKSGKLGATLRAPVRSGGLGQKTPATEAAEPVGDDPDRDHDPEPPSPPTTKKPPPAIEDEHDPVVTTAEAVPPPTTQRGADSETASEEPTTVEVTRPRRHKKRTTAPSADAATEQSEVSDEATPAATKWAAKRKKTPASQEELDSDSTTVEAQPETTERPETSKPKKKKAKKTLAPEAVPHTEVDQEESEAPATKAAKKKKPAASKSPSKKQKKQTPEPEGDHASSTTAAEGDDAAPTPTAASPKKKRSKSPKTKKPEVEETVAADSDGDDEHRTLKPLSDKKKSKKPKKTPAPVPADGEADSAQAVLPPPPTKKMRRGIDTLSPANPRGDYSTVEAVPAPTKPLTPPPLDPKDVGSDLTAPFPDLPEPVEVEEHSKKQFVIKVTNPLPVNGTEELADSPYSRTSTRLPKFDRSFGRTLAPGTDIVDATRRGQWPIGCSTGYEKSSTTSPKFTLCNHGMIDVVSGNFVRFGYWRDCLPLPFIAKWAASGSTHQNKDGRPTVVEVGGNIGTCAMLMASQGIHVTTFEPVPANHKLLAQSVAGNRYEGRVNVVGAGAAAKAGSVNITVEKGNYGNSFLKTTDRTIRAVMQEPETIELVKLDDVIHHHVHLLKLDCQGSELLALKGAKKLLSKHGVDVIRAEVDGRLMNVVGSKPLDLIRVLMKLKYRLFDERTGYPILPGKNATAFATRTINDPSDVLALSPHIVAKDIAAHEAGNKTLLESIVGKAAQKMLLDVLVYPNSAPRAEEGGFKPGEFSVNMASFLKQRDPAEFQAPTEDKLTPPPLDMADVGSNLDAPFPKLPEPEAEERETIPLKRDITNPERTTVDTNVWTDSMGGNRTKPYAKDVVGKWAYDFCTSNMAAQSSTEPSFKLCHHGKKDVISGHFALTGVWRDCLPLPFIAKWAAAGSPYKSKDKMPTVVEVGGNIGSCAMLMASQGIHVTTFEPVPANHKLLAQSVLGNQYPDMVEVVGAGAAAKAGSVNITVEKGNYGNSFLKTTDRTIRAVMQEPETIELVKLDDIVHNHVHLLKLDCQGSELLALKGAKKLLDRHGVDVIRAEMDGRLMNVVGSKPLDLIRMLMKLKYRLFDERTGYPILPGKNATAFATRTINDPSDVLALSPTMMHRELNDESILSKIIGKEKSKVMLATLREKDEK